MLKVPKVELWSPTAATTLHGCLRQSASWATCALQLVKFFQDAMEDWSLGPEHCKQEENKRRVSLEHLRDLSRPVHQGEGQSLRALSHKKRESGLRGIAWLAIGPGALTVLHA